MTRKCTVVSFIVFALLVLSAQSFCATINIHWTPNLNGGGVAHGTTVSGNIWINFIQPTDSDPNTTENMTFVEGYIQENSHNAPQVSLSMPNSSTCSSCAGSNQMVISTDPSVIMQLNHNATYTIYIKARVSGIRMFPLGQLTPYDVTQTITVTGDGLVFTSSPDDKIAWDPATMSSVNISSAYDDAQTGTCSLTYDIYSTAGGLVYTKQVTNLDRPGSDTWAWTGLNSSNLPVEKGLYVVKSTVTSNIPTMTSDCNRSGYLTVNNVSVSYTGTTSGNNNFLVSYTLTDTAALSAASGMLTIYDTDCNIAGTHSLSSLTTSTGGTSNSTSVSVPTSSMQDPGQYKFVIHCVDGHANDYRDHENKPALDVSSYWTIPTIYIINPIDDPTDPDDLGIADEGKNEFTFDDTSNPVCLIECLAGLSPDTAETRNWAESNLTWSISPGITGSTLSWGSVNGGTFTALDNLGYHVWAQFQNLPLDSSCLGNKTIQLNAGSQNLTAPIQIFFPKYATNHPGSDPGTPNWFYYWRKAFGLDNNTFEYDADPPQEIAEAEPYGYVEGMALWSYDTLYDKVTRYICSYAATVAPAIPELEKNGWSGIDLFYNIVLHENEHVRQIAAADAIVGTAANTCWRYGWSWKHPDTELMYRHVINHYAVGPNGVPGVANFDDDNDNIIDNQVVTSRGEMGSGDDEWLDYHISDDEFAPYWPSAWGMPIGFPDSIYMSPIEDAAFRMMNVIEDVYWEWDWGSPGKQHKTNRDYND